jgi:mono/diheme cytochrome c family protein
MKSTLILLLLFLIVGCKSEENKETVKKFAYSSSEENFVKNDSVVQKSESYKRGKEIYTDFCITCHLANGKGIAGTFPPLDGSDWLTEKRLETIHAVKFGLQGPIEVNGEKYDMAMAPQGLTDKEVADVLNYVMNSWSNSNKKPVTPEEVKAVKK